MSRDAIAFVCGASSRLVGARLHGALSALSKAFIPSSLVLLNSSGCYLEVGKNNIWSEAHMAAAVACEPFCLVAADYQPARWTVERLGELTNRVSCGEVGLAWRAAGCWVPGACYGAWI